MTGLPDSQGQGDGLIQAARCSARPVGVMMLARVRPIEHADDAGGRTYSIVPCSMSMPMGAIVPDDDQDRETYPATNATAADDGSKIPMIEPRIVVTLPMMSVAKPHRNDRGSITAQ